MTHHLASKTPTLANSSSHISLGIDEGNGISRDIPVEEDANGMPIRDLKSGHVTPNVPSDATLLLSFDLRVPGGRSPNPLTNAQLQSLQREAEALLSQHGVQPSSVKVVDGVAVAAQQLMADEPSLKEAQARNIVLSAEGYVHQLEVRAPATQLKPLQAAYNAIGALTAARALP